MRKLAVVLVSFIAMSFMTACGTDDEPLIGDFVEKHIAKTDLSFECVESAIPGSTYKVSIDADTNVCHIIEESFSTALDVENTVTEADVVLTDAEYERIMYILDEIPDENMTDDESNIVRHYISDYLASVFYNFMTGDTKTADLFLGEYYDSMMTRITD